MSNNQGKEGMCPRCKNDNLETTDTIKEFDSFAYEWKCTSCGATGRDWYRLTFDHQFSEDGIIYPYDFIDFSDGKDVPDSQISTFVNDCLKGLMKDNRDRWSISTGNLLVIALRYETEIQVYVTKNYQVKNISI